MINKKLNIISKFNFLEIIIFKFLEIIISNNFIFNIFWINKLNLFYLLIFKVITDTINKKFYIIIVKKIYKSILTQKIIIKLLY